jgi:hypothetical protein
MLAAVALAATIHTTANAGAAAAKTTTVTAPAVVQGVGVQLLDQQNITFPATATLPVRTELEPDTYIGAKYAIGGGTTADPIAPGTSRTYHIAITNTGNTTGTMSSFADGAALTGTSFVGQTGAAYGDAASLWTSVPAAPAVLAPGASHTENVTVTVPAATKAGTYYAVVWAGPKATTPTASANVSLQIYAGIREYITVS